MFALFLCALQVVNPLVRAFLFTWGEKSAGRTTAEGEHLPVLVQVRLPAV